MSPELALATFQPTLPLAVAFSGGADSTAVLLGCARRWPGKVRAIHVHHGLQAAADDFVRHCQDFCTQLGVPLQVCHVQAGHSPGQSPEDAARIARYDALRNALLHTWPEQPGHSIALGHHADDQAETLLLALSRGSGLPGLSAMPAHAVRKGIHYHRPLLAVASAEIRLWLTQQGVPWLDDPTNAQTHYTRNRMRAQLLPVLDQVFPQFRSTFARSAAHAAQAQQVLDEVAASDLAALQAPGQPHPLIKGVQALSLPRQANVLRYWLKHECHASASAAQLDELLSQVQACRTRGHQIQLKVGHGFVRRNMDRLDWYNPGFT